MLINKNVTRRRLLENTATTMLLYPLLKLFRETEAYAAGPATPNAIFLYYGAGSYRDSFVPKGSASSLDSFPVVTAPLAPHKADLTFFQGLCTRGASNHYGGPKQVLAGWTQGYDGANAMPYSIDQLLADRIGKDSRKKLVNVGCMSTLDGASAEAISYNAAGQAQPAQDNPKAAYDDIFGGFSPSAFNGSSALALANDQVVSGKKRMLDFVSADMKKIKSTLGPIEGQIYEAHVTALDDLEAEINRLAQQNMGNTGNTGNTGSMSTGDSGKPSRCDPNALMSSLPQGTGQGWFQKTEISAQVNTFNRKLIVEAISCGITRVATMQYGFSDCGREFCFDGTPITGVGYHSNTHANTDGLHNIQAAIMKEVALMIADLKSIKVGDKTLFDSTLIMCSSDMGDNPNNHDGISIPCFLAGNLGGKLKGNRLIAYPYEAGATSSGTDFNHLLVTVAQLMGLSDVTSIGNSKIVGPLKEV